LKRKERRIEIKKKRSLSGKGTEESGRTKGGYWRKVRLHRTPILEEPWKIKKLRAWKVLKGN
jgi:hypothetical protein